MIRGEDGALIKWMFVGINIIKLHAVMWLIQIVPGKNGMAEEELAKQLVLIQLYLMIEINVVLWKDVLGRMLDGAKKILVAGMLQTQLMQIAVIVILNVDGEILDGALQRMVFQQHQRLAEEAEEVLCGLIVGNMIIT